MLAISDSYRNRAEVVLAWSSAANLSGLRLAWLPRNGYRP